jgi:hypothetical protein
LSSAPQTPTLPAPTPPTLPRPGAAGASRSVLGKVKRTILAEPSDAAVAEPPRGKRGRPRKAPADAQPAVAVPPSAEDILSVQQCAGVLRCFFEFTTHFVSGEGDVQPIVHGLLKSVFAMMPRSMAADAQTARFFDPTVAADGLRFLPLLPQESTPASGVELHRRALALEQRVSQLVRLLRGVGAEKLNAEDARDLDVAARCCDGNGSLPAPPPDSPTRAAGLHALLQAVHRARDAALRREILIADHVTWAVPVLLTLFLLRVEGRSDNACLIKLRLEELNTRRDKALRHDTLPLRRYGWQLTVLARRLRQLMERATGGSPFQLSLVPPDYSNGRRALAFVREDPPTNAANEESLRRLHRENYTKYVSGPAGMSTAHAPTLTRARRGRCRTASWAARNATWGCRTSSAPPRSSRRRRSRWPSAGGWRTTRTASAARGTCTRPRASRRPRTGLGSTSEQDRTAGAPRGGSLCGGVSRRPVIKAAVFD